MEPHLVKLLADLEQLGRENDARETDHKKKMLNLEPDTARLVYILVRSSGAKRVLEIGTSNGYSTIWLASAVVPHGGHVTTIDVSPENKPWPTTICGVPACWNPSKCSSARPERSSTNLPVLSM